ncbi:DUF1460 domain-containing protein [Pluralibacter gergoviae]
MRTYIRITVLLLGLAGASLASGAEVAIDGASAARVDDIIAQKVVPYAGEPHGQTLARVSAAFLGTRYQAGTLAGGPATPEALVVNFNGVDCFTFADYIEALSRSRDRQSFINNLARIRYVNGRVDYLSRRHFFSDWFATAPRNALDITPTLGARYLTVQKQLNIKPGGGVFIPGLPVRPRSINYIPGRAVDARVLEKLKEGDYVGIYSPLPGLDVTHVGIVVRRGGQIWFRDASSTLSERKVIDSPFLAYVRSKPGIVVLRAE